MKTGVLYTNDDKIRGVNVTEEGKTFKVNEYFSDLEFLRKTKNPVIGLPFDKFITKTVKLPKLSKDELKNAIELQEQFIQGEEDHKQYMLNTTVLPQSSGYLLFIVAAYVPEEFKSLKSSVIVPAQLGLYAFANKEKLIDHKKSVMLVYVGFEYTHLIITNELTVVFMRTFTSKSDLNSEMRLSEQAVYLQSERCFLNIDEYIIFYNDGNIKKKLNVADGANVRWIDVLKYKHLGEEMIIPLGLSFYHYSAKLLAGWNIAKKPLSVVDSLRRSLYWLVPVLLLFLPVYYYADYYSDQTKIRALKNEIIQISGQAGNVDIISEKVREAKKILKDYAGPCLGYAKFDHLLSFIDNSRPMNLWLTNISGKIGGGIVVTGFAGSFFEINALINKLNDAEFIKNLNLNYSNASSAGKVNFQLTMELDSSYDFISEKAEKLKKIQDKSEIKHPEKIVTNDSNDMQKDETKTN